MGIEFFYDPTSPPCQVVWAALEALGLDYKATKVDLMTGEHMSDKFKAINPTQQVPAIKDGDFCLGQSRAIAIYLCQKYEAKDKKEKLIPIDIEELAKFNAILFRDVDNYLAVINYIDADNVYVIKATGPREDLFTKAKRVLDEMDRTVANSTYVFGDHVTLLDFVVIATVYLMEVVKFDVWGTYPNLERYRKTMSKLPYFEKCIVECAKENSALYQDCCKKAAEKK